MGCLFALLAGFFPRLALFIVWVARPVLVAAAFSTWIVPLLGIIFLPFATLIYVILYTPGLGLTGLEWQPRRCPHGTARPVEVEDWVEHSPEDAVAYRDAVRSRNFMQMRQAAFRSPASAKLERLTQIVEEAGAMKVVILVTRYC